MNQCPERSELLDLLNETCSVHDRERLEDHVGTCETCQRELQNLAVDGTHWDTWEDRIRNDPSSWQDKTLTVPDQANPETWPEVPGYELLSVLGQGGMGVVFKARHLALSRLVALKTLPSAGPERSELRRRLLREAETLAQLHHPHIVQIFEVLETEESVVLVLELIHGGSLTDRLRDSTLRPMEAARLVERLARTIQVAHDAGIIHRDLKPSNVLLTDDGDAKIADFGIARQLDVEGETQTGRVIGTPSYLAPEQAQCLPGWVTPLVDVYGLGAILYESLAGRPPFRGANTFETLRQVIHEEPASPTRLQPGIPRDLVTICLKCLQKDRTKRYASCLELAEDLGRFQSGQPILARRTSFPQRLFKWGRRHPRVAVLTGLLIAGLAALLGIWLDFTRELSRVNQSLREETERANRGEIAAREAQASAETQRIIAENTLSQVSGALRGNARIAVDESGENKALSFLVPAKTYETVLARFDSPNLRMEQANGYHWLGRKLLEIGDAKQAAYFINKAILIRQNIKAESRLLPGDYFEFAQSLADYGLALRKLKEFSEAEKSLSEAIRILTSPDAVPDGKGYAEAVAVYKAGCLLELAKIYELQGRNDEAKATLKKAAGLRDEIPNPELVPDAKAILQRIDARLKILKSVE